MRQETFVFPLSERFQAKDYVVGACNEKAWQWLQSWPEGAGGESVRITLLVGAKSSGKSHLANIWAERVGAEDLRARVEAVLGDCDSQDISIISSDILGGLPSDGAYVFENLWDWLGSVPNINSQHIRQPLKEQILFHLYNHIVANGSGCILFTANAVLADSPLGLADLRSRLGTAYTILVEHPDDETLEAVYRKLFQDRQLAVSDAVISYLKTHCDRTLTRVKRLVADIDECALRNRKAITISLVRGVLEQKQLGLF